MSGTATGWVLRHGPHPDMVDREGRKYGARARGLRTVLHTIADSANADGHHSHPGLDNLVEFSLYSRRQVITLTQELEAEGWLMVEERGRGRGHATKWTVVGVDRKVQPPHASDLPDRCTPDRTYPAIVPDPEKVQSDAEKVQPAAEKVQSRLHPNGVTTVVATEEPPSSPPASSDLVLVEAPPAECDHRSDGCPHFAAFWERYPRRIDRPGSRRKLAAALKVDDLEVILAGLDAWVVAWDGREPQFIPHPTTWLNQQRWRDVPLVAQPPASKRVEHERGLRTAAERFLETQRPQRDALSSIPTKELTRGVS